MMLSSACGTFTRSFVPLLSKNAFRSIATATLASQQHIVVALGGNALLKRGEEMTMENQRCNIREGLKSLKSVIKNNNVTIVHGNGPQSGLLVLESSAYEKLTGLKQMQLDVIDAETEGMIGYLLEQELEKYIPPERGMVTMLSQILVDERDPAFKNPTKFIGPIMTKSEAEKLGLPVKPDGIHYRRVVPSPLPVRMLDHQMTVLKRLVASNAVVICAGGGGIPVIRNQDGAIEGVEAVIDKDRAACMVGHVLGANGFLILTDVPGAAIDFNTDHRKYIRHVSAKKLASLLHLFPDGSMGPKCSSAIDFVNLTGGWAAIGNIEEADKIVSGQAGTIITKGKDDDYITFHDSEDVSYPQAA